MTTLETAARTGKAPQSLTFKQRTGRLLFANLPITRFLFDQLRTELNCWMVRFQNAVLPWRRQRFKRLRKLRGVRANVACGPNPLDGFVNLDLYTTARNVIRWDCRWDLPFADDSVIGIRIEQFLEHLEPREEAPSFLNDCLRVLQDGGVLRVIVPDAERYMQAYCRPDMSGFRELKAYPFPADLPTRADIVNHVFHQWHEHRWGYDFEALAHRLRQAGFACVEKMTFGRSLDDVLAQDCEVHRPYSLYVDALKGSRTSFRHEDIR